MKKLLLSLGALSAVVAPVAAVVACGSTETPAKPAKTDAFATNKATALTTLDALTLSDAAKATFTTKINDATTTDEIAAAITEATTTSMNNANKAPKLGVGTELKAKIQELGFDISTLSDESKLIMNDMKVLNVFDGVMPDGTHGTDDHLIILSDGEDRDVQANDGHHYMDFALANHDGEIYSVVNTKGASFESRWGDASLAALQGSKAKIAVYIQGDSTKGVDCIFEVEQLFTLEQDNSKVITSVTQKDDPKNHLGSIKRKATA